MDKKPDSDTWSDFQKYLIKRIDELQKDVNAQKVIAAKSGAFWGGVTAIVTVVGSVIIKSKGG